jgi:nucleotide-binding universal stress UspA family protein
MAATTKLTFSPETCPTFKNLLFTTDFSQGSDLALGYATAVAQRYGSTVHILHVVNPELVVGQETYRVEALSFAEDEATFARKEMDKLVQSGALKEIPYMTIVSEGPLWDVIAETVGALKIDMIILGTHGRGGLGHLLLGSIAEEIFRRADCPVLTVGPKAQHGFCQERLETIVYATDLSVTSRSALPHALCFASANQAKLVVVHAAQSVITPRGNVLAKADDMASSARLDLAKLMPDNPEIRHEIVTKAGSPADVILEVAKQTGAGLIVMGANRRTSSHKPWATAHQVVCHAECPVLTVRS